MQPASQPWAWCAQVFRQQEEAAKVAHQQRKHAAKVQTKEKVIAGQLQAEEEVHQRAVAARKVLYLLGNDALLDPLGQFTL